MSEKDEPSKGRQPVPPVAPSKTREEEERKRREDEQKQREKPAKRANPETGEVEEADEEEEEHPGKPLREDDAMNKFMAPDVKPIGAIYGEDLLQDDPEKRKEMEEPPPETHPQQAQKEPSKAPASR